jgi:hypothetical protein
MHLLYRLPLFLLSAFLLVPGYSLAGTITVSGSLLGESIATPTLLGGGETFDLPFAANFMDLGVISGIVHLGNEAAAAGVIRVVDLQFQSLRPRGAGEVSFTVAVDQDFAYAGPPRVDGAFSLSSRAVFTAFPQSASGMVAGFLGVVLDPLPFAFAANPQDSFPQVQDFGTAGTLQAIPASETMSLRLLLSLRLSDNALSPGPRFEAVGGSGEFMSIGYTASASPIPEPSTQILLGLSALTLLGYAWRRRRVGNLIPLFSPAADSP